MQISRGLAGVVAVALLNGCNGYDKFTPRPASPSQSVAGTLPPSANDPSGTAFYDFMQTVPWGKKKTVDMCTNRLLCFFGLGKVKVDLEASQNSYLVDPRTIDSTGVLLVRAVNKGNSATAQYNFRPGYIYALVAYPDAPGDTTSHWVLNETDTTTHHTVTVAGIQGPYSPCWDSSSPAIADDVDIAKCGEHISAAVKKSAIGFFGFMDQFLAVVAAALLEESPIWKSCPSGCCTLAQS